MVEDGIVAGDQEEHFTVDPPVFSSDSDEAEG